MQKLILWLNGHVFCYAAYPDPEEFSTDLSKSCVENKKFWKLKIGINVIINSCYFGQEVNKIYWRVLS